MLQVLLLKLTVMLTATVKMSFTLFPVEGVRSSTFEKQRENLKTEWESIETMSETKY